MRRTLPLTCLLAVLLALLLAFAGGCGDSSSQADDSKLLEGKSWRAVEIAGLTEVQTGKGRAATAHFDAGQVGGSGSVNSWSASYTTGPGNTIRISDITTTEMAGPQDLMDQEAAYYTALPQASGYEVTDAGLTLLDKNGNPLVRYEVVRPTPLTGTEWRATAYNNGRGGLQTLEAGSAITALFGTDGTLTGNGTINQYSTTYTAAADGGMSIDPRIATTKIGGPEELMAQETAYLTALPTTATYSVEGDELWLRDASGGAVAQFAAE